MLSWAWILNLLWNCLSNPKKIPRKQLWSWSKSKSKNNQIPMILNCTLCTFLTNFQLQQNASNACTIRPVYNSLMYNKYSEFSLYCYWIMLIFKPFQIQIRVWRWLFESLYKRTRREISLWQTWLWILWNSNATCCQNRGSQISVTIQGKKHFYYSYHILIKFWFFLILMHTNAVQKWSNFYNERTKTK